MPLSIDIYGYVMFAALAVVVVVNFARKVFSQNH